MDSNNQTNEPAINVTLSDIITGFNIPYSSDIISQQRTVQVQIVPEPPGAPSVAIQMQAEAEEPEVVPNTRQKRYEGSEHITLGSGVTIQLADSRIPGNDPYFPMGYGNNKVSLTFGQIVALSGDFYCIADKPICGTLIGMGGFPPDVAFTNAFNSLVNADTTELSNILSLLNNELVTSMKAFVNGESTTKSIKDISNSNSAKWNFMTRTPPSPFQQIPNSVGDVDFVRYFTYPMGRYLLLAQNNFDHFGVYAIAAYKAGQNCATEKAIAGDLTTAYAMNAFANHFLTDLFAAGHLRVPRLELHTFGGAIKDPLDLGCGDLMAKAMHDEDNTWGLCVSNKKGNKWRCFGDAELLTEKNLMNYQIAKNAIQASVDEVYEAYQDKSYDKSYKALDYIPDLDALKDPNNKTNFAGLYTVNYAADKGKLYERDDLASKDKYKWEKVGEDPASEFGHTKARAQKETPPANFPNSPKSKPSLDFSIYTSGLNQIPDWKSGNKVRYAVGFVYKFSVFDGNQDSDRGPWTDNDFTFVPSNANSGSYKKASPCYYATLKLPQLPANAIGWNIYRQFKDPRGILTMVKMVAPYYMQTRDYQVAPLATPQNGSAQPVNCRKVGNDYYFDDNMFPY